MKRVKLQLSKPFQTDERITSQQESSTYLRLQFLGVSGDKRNTLKTWKINGSPLINWQRAPKVVWDPPDEDHRSNKLVPLLDNQLRRSGASSVIYQVLNGGENVAFRGISPVCLIEVGSGWLRLGWLVEIVTSLGWLFKVGWDWHCLRVDIGLVGLVESKWPQICWISKGTNSRWNCLWSTLRKAGHGHHPGKYPKKTWHILG